MRGARLVGRVVAAVAVAIGAFGVPRSVRADGEVPFPTDKSTILRVEKTVYYVEGRQVIPKGVEISCQKDVKIVGRGENATIVVEGSLQVHGVSAREVIFEHITVEPAPVSEDIQLDMCIFRGSGGVRTPKDGHTEGKIVIDNVSFDAGTTFDVANSKGEIDLLSTKSADPVAVRGVPQEKGPNKTTLAIRGCSMKGGIEVSGCDDVTVRTNHIHGAAARAVFTDNLTLIFDGNKVATPSLEFRQTEAGRFGKTKLQKCDIYSASVLLHAPRMEGQKDRVTVDKCWFRGIVAPKEIAEKVLRDGDDDPENGAYFTLKKVNERPLELAGSLDR